MKRICCLLVAAVLLVVPFIHAEDRVPSKDASPAIPNFTLADTAGKAVSLADFKDKKAVAVVFLGVECPVVNLFVHRLKQLHEEFAPQGVQFLGINSNSQDSAEAVAEHAKKHALPFPILKDAGHKVADLFKAQRTPEAFAVDAKGVVVYRGRIDDQYGVGYQRPKPHRRDLGEALTEILAGKPVSVPRTEVEGCFIGRESAASRPPLATEITYTKHVAGIIQKHCQECHRPGQIGPFALTTYKHANAWSQTIAEVVKDGRMPPWHADPKHGKFSNDRSMSKADRDTLLAWIEQGCPKGDEKDLPPPRQFLGSDGWQIGKPDVILTMKEEFKVPAVAPKGGVPYQYFWVPTNFEEDKWVQMAEAKPGNKAVVHHIIAYVLEPGQKLDERGDDRLGHGLLVATAPGDIPAIFEPGLAKKVPKGSYLLFQMHYTPNGVEGTDRSCVGLIFAKEPPKHAARTRSIGNGRFTIPPGDDNHKVESRSVFKKDAMLINFMPHMHLRGKSFEYRLVHPDGKSEVLLSVPRYDFGWQTYYRLEKPVHIPAGARIECTAHFDNSEKNKNNPDPTVAVRWGDQTWQEMMIGWIDYYYVDERP